MKDIFYDEAMKGLKVLCQQYREKLISIAKGEATPGTNIKKLKSYNLWRGKIDDGARIVYTRQGNSLLVLYIGSHDGYEAYLKKDRNVEEPKQLFKKFLESDKEEPETIDIDNDFEEVEFNQNVNGNGHEELNLIPASYSQGQYITFYGAQTEVFTKKTPFIILGPAGSGKTSTALKALIDEAIKSLDDNTQVTRRDNNNNNDDDDDNSVEEDIQDQKFLYVAQSKRLVKSIRKEFKQHPLYEQLKDMIDILSCQELYIKNNPHLIPVMVDDEIKNDLIVDDRKIFDQWFSQLKNSNSNDRFSTSFGESPKLVYEEFKIISGHTKDKYITGIGQRQSLAKDQAEREVLWGAYERFNDFILSEKKVAVGFSKLNIAKKYQMTVVDEIIDLSLKNINELSDSAKNLNVIFCNDPKQSDEYTRKTEYLGALFHDKGKKIENIHLPTIYRCPKVVVEFASVFDNFRLALDSNKRVEPAIILPNTENEGFFSWIGTVPQTPADWEKTLTSENLKITDSVNVCVVVDEALIPDINSVNRIRNIFGISQILTPKQIKGLEFETVIYFHFLQNPIFKILNNLLQAKLNNNSLKITAEEKEILSISTACAESLVAGTRSKKNLIVIEPKKQHALRHIEEQINAAVQKYKHLRMNSSSVSSITNWQERVETLEDIEGTQDTINAIREKHLPSSTANNNNNNNANLKSEENSASPSSSSKKQAKKSKLSESTEKEQQKQAESLKKIVSKEQEELNRKLCLETKAGNLTAVKTLLKQGADPYAINQDKDLGHEVGFAPLHLAVINNYEKIIQKLLLHDKKMIQIKTGDGAATPLHLVAQNCTPITTKILLDNGANPNEPNKQGVTPFHLIAQGGNEKLFQLFISQPGINIHAKNIFQVTPLFLAAQYGHEKIVDRLLILKADPTIKNINGGATALHMAAQNGHTAVVKRLLLKNTDKTNKKVDINAKNDTGLAASHVSACNGHTAVLSLLFDHGAIVNAKNDGGLTPLHAAIQEGKIDAIKLILKYDADVNATINPTDEHGPLTPLEFSVFFEQFLVTLYLVKEQRNKITSESFIKTQRLILSYMSQHQNSKEIQLLNRILEELAKILNSNTNIIIPSNTDINKKDKNGSFLLNSLLIKEDFNKILLILRTDSVSIEEDLLRKFLDSCEAKLKTQESSSSSSSSNISSSSELLRQVYNETMILLLFSSIHTNNLSYATILCQKKVKVNFQKNGVSALHLAAQAGHTKIVQMLLDNDADPNIQNQQKVAPLHLAAINNHADTLEPLFNKGTKLNVNITDKAEMTPLHFAAKNGNLSVVQKLLTMGKATIDLKDRNGFTPLHFAVQEGTLDVITFLIDHGSHVNSLSTTNVTPLHLASQRGDREIFIFLLTRGADRNLKTSTGASALHMATQESYLHIVQELFRNNSNTNPIDTNIKTLKGNTALHSAAQEGHTEIATLLLENGADINAKNNDTLTPLDLAMLAKKLEFALFLLNFYIEKKRLVEEKVLLNMQKMTLNALNTEKAGAHADSLTKISTKIKELLTPKSMLTSSTPQGKVTPTTASSKPQFDPTK